MGWKGKMGKMGGEGGGGGQTTGTYHNRSVSAYYISVSSMYNAVVKETLVGCRCWVTWVEQRRLSGVG